MIKHIGKVDSFAKNIILVFAGASIVNFFNLLYQLLIAHRFSPPDFAAFNSLLSFFMLISAATGTFQVAIAKYAAEFSAKGLPQKARALFSYFLKITSFLAFMTFIIFYLAYFFLLDKFLKINSISCGFILAVMVGLSWVIPIFLGGLQGLELFKLLTLVSLLGGILKLLFAFVFIELGFKVAGALGAFLIAVVISLAIGYFGLKDKISFKGSIDGEIKFGEIIFYLFPIALSSFCFMSLVTADMILVRNFFSPQDSGIYSLAQMVGKIFLFLPGAISMVMFPRTCGLNAKNMDTTLTLKRSLLYAIILCIIAMSVYNLFPAPVLRMLTGKSTPDSVVLGRFFSVSMSFFALLFILITYFLSLKDLRFIKYLGLTTVLQFLAISFFHDSLIQVQLILCANSILLFVSHLLLVYRGRKFALAGNE